MYAAAQAGKLPIYHRKIRRDHGAGEETGEKKELKYLLKRGNGQEELYEKEQKDALLLGDSSCSFGFGISGYSVMIRKISLSVSRIPFRPTLLTVLIVSSTPFRMIPSPA